MSLETVETKEELLNKIKVTKWELRALLWQKKVVKMYYKCVVRAN